MNADCFAAINHGFSEPVRDPLWGHIYLTPQLSALLESSAFQRLRRIQQLGPTSAVYPGATHTRAAHSLGVYHLARRMLQGLLEQGADSWCSPLGISSFLVAALSHDLGHFPYTHSLKEFPLMEHESLSAQLLLNEELKPLVGQCGADPYMAAAIIDTALPCAENTETLFYRHLLSGVLDPDKLDYLNRDARYCGVPYGAQDIDFIFSRLRPHPERGVDIDSRGVQSVEAVLFAKYLMYRSVYWHRDVRSATAMIKKALYPALSEGRLRGEELYNLDDQGLFHCMDRLGRETAVLGSMVRDGRFYTQIAEFPFNPERVTHSELLDLETRMLSEQELAKTLSSIIPQTILPRDILIDVPEAVSFESSLYIHDEGVSFSHSSTVFRAETVRSFTESLRMLRVFVQPSLRADLQGASVITERIASVFSSDV